MIIYGKARAAGLPFAERAMARAAGLPFVAYAIARAPGLPFAACAMARAAGLLFVAYAIARAPGLPFLTSGNAITIARGMGTLIRQRDACQFSGAGEIPPRNYVTTLLAILVRRKGQVLLPFLSHYRSLHLALLIDLPPYSKDRHPPSNGLWQPAKNP